MNMSTVFDFLFEILFFGVVIGIVASLLSSGIWWWATHKKKWANIKFSNCLQIKPVEFSDLPGKYQIAFKIANIGSSDFEQVNLDAKLAVRVKGRGLQNAYLAVGWGGNYVNRLWGQKNIKRVNGEPNKYTFILPIYLSDQAFSRFSGTMFMEDIKQKAERKELSLWDVFKAYPDEAHLTLFAYGYEVATGLRKTFESKRYTFNDIEALKFQGLSMRTEMPEKDKAHFAEAAQEVNDAKSSLKSIVAEELDE
ncbi:MAG: hypothetical protein FWC76_08205 [Defluviitaleaceae bacterium]|nr:hypothetical protein [Defluviitaleaceae bacterium]